MRTGSALLAFGLAISTATTALAQEPAPGAAEEPTPGADTAPPKETDAPKPPIEPTEEASKSPAAPASPTMEDEYSPPKEQGGAEHADEDFGHGMQFGLRAGVVGGYRMIFRYDKSPFCRAKDPTKDDKNEQKFCGHGAPFGAEVALSFAIFDFAEPYVWGRFGFGGEAQTNTEALLAFGLGARIYTMSDSKFKVFVEPALGMELEKGAGNGAWDFDPPGGTPDYKTDFLFHLHAGPQYDFAKAFGIYLSAGLTTGILRYIHTSLELSGGVQLRVP